jgi:gamma-glutamyltranspeptidase/glutathione hydrolase
VFVTATRFKAIDTLSAVLISALLALPLNVYADAAVAVSDQYGTQSAKWALTHGGNAVDAAVATAFTLAVTFPEAGNLGGGGFATVWFKGQAYFLDYREAAPAKASRNMYLDSHGNVIEDLSTTGALAAGVPGTVRGLWELHHRFGQLPWKDVLRPAIEYAENGFTVPPTLADAVAETIKDLHGKTNFAQYYQGMHAQEVFKQPLLAQVLKRIQAEGPKGFYEGRTAEDFIAAIRSQNGIINFADLKHYQAHWREPLIQPWLDYQIVTAPPPSSGGVALLSLLGMKQRLSTEFANVALNSADYVHLTAEMEKRIFADRGEIFGDPDFVSMPIKALLDPNYLDQRVVGISKDHLTPTGSVKPGFSHHHNTTHFSIVDHDGNAVSNTYTLNDEFGARTVAGKTGVLLNNEMDDFSIKAGVPNIYGVIGGDANAIAPHKRPLSSMTPTIVLKDGHPVMVIGTPGGSRIFTSVYQVIVNWHDYHLPLYDAVSQPRFHHQLLPDNLIFEEPYMSLNSATKDQLMTRGYHFENQGWNGDIQALAIDHDHWVAVSDPRGRGVSAVINERTDTSH